MILLRSSSYQFKPLKITCSAKSTKAQKGGIFRGCADKSLLFDQSQQTNKSMNWWDLKVEVWSQLFGRESAGGIFILLVICLWFCLWLVQRPWNIKPQTMILLSWQRRGIFKVYFHLLFLQVYYLRQGHELYVKEVMATKCYDINPKKQCYYKLRLKVCQCGFFFATSSLEQSLSLIN